MPWAKNKDFLIKEITLSLNWEKTDKLCVLPVKLLHRCYDLELIVLEHKNRRLRHATNKITYKERTFIDSQVLTPDSNHNYAIEIIFKLN